jgi:hypothetical protein
MRKTKMASTPRFKIYSAAGEYLAATKYVEEAAAVVALQGQGATIRDGHERKHVVWTEGVDGEAFESYDNVCEMVHFRITGKDRTC